MTDRRGRLFATNFAASASFAGGGWSAALPLANLQDVRLRSKPARSASLQPDDTRFDANFGRVRKVSIVAVLGTNITSGAAFRLRLARAGDFDAPEHDTGWTEAYPPLFATAQLDYEDENWWTGQPLEADIAPYHRNIVVLLDPPVVATDLRVECDDPSNPDGALDLGFLFAAGGVPPAYNFTFGSPRSLRSRTLRELTPSGHEVFDRRPLQRAIRIDYDALTKDEAIAFHDAAARNDVVDPVLFIPDPGDGVHLFREAFLARFEALPDRVPTASGNRMAIQLHEVIA